MKPWNSGFSIYGNIMENAISKFKILATENLQQFLGFFANSAQHEVYDILPV